MEHSNEHGWGVGLSTFVGTMNWVAQYEDRYVKEFNIETYIKGSHGECVERTSTSFHISNYLVQRYNFPVNYEI